MPRHSPQGDGSASRRKTVDTQGHGENLRSPPSTRNRLLSSKIDHDARLTLRLLNKLTPTNFDKLVTDFWNETTLRRSSTTTTSSSSTSAHHRNCMRYTVEAIVARAASDVRFADMYAELCLRFVTDLSHHHGTTFRDVLLQACMDVEVVDDSNSHYYIGTKRFLGHLCNHGVVSVQEVLYELDSLLQKSRVLPADSHYDEKNDDDDMNDDDDNDDEIDEVVLEGLCILLSTCGQTLEGTVTSFESMQLCWHALHKVAHNHNDHPERTAVSFRLRHIVLELLELHASAWNPTRYSARSRKEMVAKPLLDSDRVQPRRHKEKKKRNRVRFGNSTS